MSILSVLSKKNKNNEIIYDAPVHAMPIKPGEEETPGNCEADFDFTILNDEGLIKSQLESLGIIVEEEDV